jgi:hypothetical protein
MHSIGSGACVSIDVVVSDLSLIYGVFEDLVQGPID